MLKAFNSFQMVGVFAAFPFLISWLNEATFRGASIGFWISCVAYCVMFVLMCVAVFVALDSDK